MANKENKDNKLLDELRRRGTIFEDPCPKSEGFMAQLQISVAYFCSIGLYFLV